MTRQQIAMIEALIKRNITSVIVVPTCEKETVSAEANLTKIEAGKYQASIEQLKAYYEAQ